MSAKDDSYSNSDIMMGEVETPHQKKVVKRKVEKSDHKHSYKPVIVNIPFDNGRHSYYLMGRCEECGKLDGDSMKARKMVKGKIREVFENNIFPSADEIAPIRKYIDVYKVDSFFDKFAYEKEV